MTTITEATTRGEPQAGGLKSIRLFLERHRSLREAPTESLAAAFSDRAFAAEYFKRFFDICEELLSRVEDHDVILQGLASRLETRQPETPGGMRQIQAAILERLRTALAGVPDGTYFAISYTGKILAQSPSQSEIARTLSQLPLSLSQVFIYVKGGESSFGER